MRYWVYIHTCPNGKKYVGCTIQDKPEWRWQNGRGYGNGDFAKDIKVFGWNNITHETFEMNSKEEMWYLEKYLIALYDTANPEKGYNKAQGGENSSLGCHHSKEFRKRCSERMKANPNPNFTMREKHHSEETKKKMSEVRKGKPHPWSKGVPRSGESKRKTSETLKGKPQPRFLYTFPDGTIQVMTCIKAYKAFKKKGINIEKGPRVI